VDTPDDSRVRVRTQTTNIDGQKGIGYKAFSYNTAFGVDTSQEEVFADAKDLVQSTIDGYNVCIFSYGQTGSGKVRKCGLAAGCFVNPNASYCRRSRCTAMMPNPA
jgi:hypothetical protein